METIAARHFPTHQNLSKLASIEHALDLEKHMLVLNKKVDVQLSRRPLEGRAAIVTGSTSGIGLGIAKALAEAGAAVMLNGFGDRDDIELQRQSLADAHDVDVAYSDADMTQADAIRLMADQAVRRFGQIDIVVNNAGIQHVAPVEAFPPEKWDQILAINLSSAFHLVRATFEGMKARKFGRIVNISSAHGLIASPFKAAYVAAKHGIIGFTKVIALEGAEAGVTSNAICPGYVWTPLVERQIDDQARSHKIPREAVIRDVLLKNQPNKRFASVEEIGALTVFLCGDGGTSVTGTAIPIDGGWTAH
jgi:3-hydroxybutyrate dehydrogenase